MNAVDTYFNAERAGGWVLVAVGIVAIGVAAWSWRYGAFWRGAAWPLVVVALLQVGVGGSVGWRSPRDAARVQHIVANERPRLASEEIPRMQQVARDFVRNRWIELAFVAIGLLAAVLAPRGSAGQGAAAGLAVQAGLVGLLDAFAERRAGEYLAWLQSL